MVSNRNNLYFQIDWHLILDILFAGINVTLNPEERVVVKEVDYLSELITLLDNTPPRVIGNYFLLKCK